MQNVLNMRDIICYDVETTGLNPKEDYIIQLSIIKMDGSALPEFKEKDRRNWYIKPAHAYTINPDAEKVHGISKDFLEKNGVLIKDIIKDFDEFIKDCDFLSYNGNTFDIKFLHKDFSTFGYDIFNTNRKYFDSYSMESRFTPRTLTAVYNKYTGETLEGAHDALNDVIGTCKVFAGQLKRYDLNINDILDWPENNLLSPEGSIRNASTADSPVVIVFSRGKYKDSDVADICKKDPSYIKWFFENVASAATKSVIREYYYKKYPKDK